MSEMRKNEILEEFRRPQGNKSSRSRDVKNRLHHFRSKETFLTDTQTSDYTKSSGEINLSRLEHLEDTVRKLQKQNSELRQRVVDLKASQCFEINEEKLKSVIRETDRLREQLEQTRKELEQSLVERDFLERFNKNLKSQCETLTKEILVLKGSGGSGQPKRPERSIYTTREEQGSRSRNGSSEVRSVSKRKEFLQWRKEKEGKGNLKSSGSVTHLEEDYYGGGGRSSRVRNFRS